jgi:hypothetical protein
MKKITQAIFWQTTLGLTIAVTLVVLLASLARCWQIGVILYRSDWIFPLSAYSVTLSVCLGLWLYARQKPDRQQKLWQFLELTALRGLGWRFVSSLVFIGIAVLIPWLKIKFQFGEEIPGSTRDPLLSLLMFYWMVWWLILLAAGAFKIALQTSWGWAFAGVLVILGVSYEIFVRLQAVTTYPFSMGWSESSRYYYASLYFSKSIYGQRYPLSTLHPTRYLLQALAFLIPNAGLTWHRFWQFLLWILLSAGTSLALAKRLWDRNRRAGWLFAGWFFVFALRVGVYYHLQVMVLIILLFVSVRNPWRSLLVIILASAWAGISRINWFPVPAMLAIAVYLLEKPVSQPDVRPNGQTVLDYLKWPVIWGGVGLITALVSQAAYIPLSGNAENAKAFTSSFTSDLIWQRLWPNDSFALGILPAILIISAPLLIVIFYALRQQWDNLHWLRLAGLLGMTGLLFAGGLVVSTKIGGGADLHNMDAYATLIGLLAAYALFGKIAGEQENRPWHTIPWPVIATSLLIPLAFLIPSLRPLPLYNAPKHARMLTQLRQQVEALAQSGPVLFINERHLVTFKQIQVPLEPDYENVTLMEMAMSGNTPYLKRFYSDLKSQRFAAIIARKQNTVILTSGAFAAENNIWNTKVSPYILCYYEPANIFPASMGPVIVYIPRQRKIPGCP